MNVFRKILRVFKRRKPLSKFNVWTKDDKGRQFHYKIAVFRLKYPGLFFVKFERYSMRSGNKIKWHRVLNSDEFFELQYRAQ